jgi:exodeoxyribonuclease VII large subunit
MTGNLSDLSKERFYSGIYVVRLSELNKAIKSTIETAFSQTLWVVAEISEMRCNTRGHCYLELVEKEDNDTIAQIRANIWARAFRVIASNFKKTTGESLGQGMKVLLQINVTFHEIYGLSLNIRDIDPAYSLGEMARKRIEVIEQLTKEGLIKMNKQICLPLVPQRIAVISSVTAAGYGDFINHIDTNRYGYKIYHTLFQAFMQGQAAGASIISAMRKVKKQRRLYDALVIVRGGGSQVDLSCFDTYEIAAEIAKFPLPVITGIGHERDYTIADITAHTKLKTPTAVAEFLLSEILRFEERIMEGQKILIQQTSALIAREDHRVRYLAQDLRHIVKEIFLREMKKIELSLHKIIRVTYRSIESNSNRLKLDVSRIAGALHIFFEQQHNRIIQNGQAIRLLDPANILKRGYSITYLNEKAIRDSEDLQKGYIIRTRLNRGSVRSIVEAMDGED